ncbi:MAG: ATP-binding cassette domain-containing protein, partial [Halofilum sp. (in: g-proteobacteria)]
MPDSSAGPNTAIRLEDVRFRWPGTAAFTIEIDSLRIDEGTRLFVRGPSGGGKSTLLALIGGVLVPERGSVQVLGADIGALTAGDRDRFRADHIGFIFQQFNLLPYLGVVDNVLLASRFSQRRAQRIRGDETGAARDCLAALGLDDETLLARPVHALSVGQQQRVAAARALLGEPGLVIADEP